MFRKVIANGGSNGDVPSPSLVIRFWRDGKRILEPDEFARILAEKI